MADNYDKNAPFNNYTNPSGNTSMNTHRGARNDIRTAVNDLSPLSSSDNGLLQTSTNIFVYANGAIVGMIQSFSVSENRTINKLQAIGWEGVVQAVPSNTNGGQLNVSRIALYESTLWNALGLTSNGQSYNPLGKKVYDHSPSDGEDKWDIATPTSDSASTANNMTSRLVFKTLKDQRVPLEIQVKTKRMGNTEDHYVETYIDCWLASYSKSYTVQSITVAETATIQYADVY